MRAGETKATLEINTTVDLTDADVVTLDVTLPSGVITSWPCTVLGEASRGLVVCGMDDGGSSRVATSGKYIMSINVLYNDTHVGKHYPCFMIIDE